jgi:hypothetical protein
MVLLTHKAAKAQEIEQEAADPVPSGPTQSKPMIHTFLDPAC